MRILLALLVLATSVPASAQLLVAKDGPVVYGHHHLNATDVPATIRFFAETLGGTAMKVGTNNADVIKFPNVFVYVRPMTKPSGGSKGTTVDHIAFSVPNLRAMLDKVKAAGYKVVTREEAAANYTVTDDIATVPGAPVALAYVMGPDELKVEFLEAKAQTAPIALSHVHFFGEKNADMQAWYVKTFGATARNGAGFLVAALPGVTLNFSPSPTPVVPTQGRVLDHIGFEVKNLEAFTKQLEAQGIKLTVPYRQVPAFGLAIAFVVDPWGTSIELTEGLDKIP